MTEFLQQNWFWILLIVFFIWMHRSGMGCGGHRRRTGEPEEPGKGGGRQH